MRRENWRGEGCRAFNDERVRFIAFWAESPILARFYIPIGEEIIGYADFLGFVPFVGGVALVVLPAPGSRSALIFLSKISLAFFPIRAMISRIGAEFMDKVSR